jgi:hypothetical protein
MIVFTYSHGKLIRLYQLDNLDTDDYENPYFYKFLPTINIYPMAFPLPLLYTGDLSSKSTFLFLSFGYTIMAFKLIENPGNFN